MSTDALVAEYFATGTLTGLPADHFIAGAFTPAVAGRRMETFDPGSALAYHAFAAGDAGDVDRAISAAKAAQRGWGRMKPGPRGAILMRAAQLMRAEAARLAVVESLDSGKTLQEAEGDIAGAARCLEYYAGAGDKMQGDSFPLGPDYLGYSVHEPVGVTAHIIPWNYPLSTAARSVAPALAAGCTVVAKPAEQTPLTALMLADILHRAGLPDGVCNVVTGTGAEAGAPLVAHPDVRHVAFTGSVGTGVRVMQAAAPNVTSVVLELGGKSPVVVMADADMDAAVEGILGAIYENAGQICSAGSRLLVERKAHGALIERLAQQAATLTLGHGLKRPQVGALTSAAHLAKVAAYVDAAKARGIAVAGSFGTLDDCVADLAMGLAIDVMRQVSAADRYVRAGHWEQARYPLSVRVSGKRLGLVGFGNIGQVIARRAGGFDMDIRYHSRHPVPASALVHEPDLHALARWSDVLVVAVSGGAGTRHLISADVLDALGPQGFLVNIARGSVIDEAALVAALSTQRIAGAGLDVFADEPHVPAALLTLDNVVLAPHMGSGTHETRKAMEDLLMANLQHYFEAGTVLTPA